MIHNSKSIDRRGFLTFLPCDVPQTLWDALELTLVRRVLVAEAIASPSSWAFARRFGRSEIGSQRKARNRETPNPKPLSRTLVVPFLDPLKGAAETAWASHGPSLPPCLHRWELTVFNGCKRNLWGF